MKASECDSCQAKCINMKTTEYCGLGDESVTLKCMIFVNGRILILTPVQSTH